MTWKRQLLPLNKYRHMCYAQQLKLLPQIQATDRLYLGIHLGHRQTQTDIRPQTDTQGTGRQATHGYQATGRGSIHSGIYYARVSLLWNNALPCTIDLRKLPYYSKFSICTPCGLYRTCTCSATINSGDKNNFLNNISFYAVSYIELTSILYGCTL